MKIGIDASNISSGGGVTHLKELLASADADRDGFSEIVVWSSNRTARQLGPRPWLQTITPTDLDDSLPRRLYWQHQTLPRELARHSCDLLFSPGSTVPNDLLGDAARARQCPAVSMSQNLLPFMPGDVAGSGVSYALKLLLLRYSQSRTFKRAAGVIFLTEFARSFIQDSIGEMDGQIQVIPHGVHQRFFKAPRAQKPLADFSEAIPFRLVYVSSVHYYKYQWNVAEAVFNLRKRGIPIAIDFVGSAYPMALPRLLSTLASLDPASEFLRYRGDIPFEEMHSVYHDADAFIFASTCENMPNILLEAMASGLPIVSSKHGPMPEVLGDAGQYLDPLNVADIEQSIAAMVQDHKFRADCAASGFERAKPFSWDNCAQSTFAFFRQVKAAQ